MYRLEYCSTLLGLFMLCALAVNGEFNNVNNNHKRKAIVAGRSVLQNEGNFQTAIIYKQRLTCSGSLLRDNVVLTSASCVKNIDLSQIIVRAGSKAFKTGGQVRSVLEILLHMLHKDDEHSNNIALLKLRRPFNLTSPSIDITQLPTVTQLEIPPSLFIYGWGISSLNVNGTLSKHLRVSKYKVYSNNKCLHYLPENDKIGDKNPLCVGDRSKHFDICNDDSGGPAVDQNRIQYGVVSYGGKCFPQGVIILSNVLPHLQWIRNVIQSWND
ncbi:mite allergen Der p 3-like [Musca autumnalis]|uniref:mite allergen Der p 3-like n=1 Tax=Musca autumnalis TaxID=221902 RepID=UPI003CF8DE87